MIGASDSVCSLLMFFTLKFPDTKMFIFPFPIPIKAYWFTGLFFLYSFMNKNSN